MTEEKAQVTKPEESPTLDTLKAAMQVAIAAGKDGDVVAIGKQIVKLKSDVEKAEADKVKAEAEAMAGDREKLAKSILAKVVALEGIIPSLEKVKAKGFTFHLADEGSNIPYLGLTVPTVKARGGGGGSTGALKEQTGMPRHELIEKYATDEEKATIKKAEADATNRPDSARYSAEKPVIKAILARNPNLIKK